MIQKPVTLTDREQDFLKFVFDNYFPWYRVPQQTLSELDPRVVGRTANAPFFCHNVMARVDEYGPGRINSDYWPIVYGIFDRWMKENSQEYSVIFRSCFNCVYHVDADYSIPHLDHNWPHSNWIMYLNDSTAPTVLFDDELNIVEEIPARAGHAVAFKGQQHAHRYPQGLDQRLVLVFTYN